MCTHVETSKTLDVHAVQLVQNSADVKQICIVKCWIFQVAWRCLYMYMKKGMFTEHKFRYVRVDNASLTECTVLVTVVIPLMICKSNYTPDRFNSSLSCHDQTLSNEQCLRLCVVLSENVGLLFNETQTKNAFCLAEGALFACI